MVMPASAVFVDRLGGGVMTSGRKVSHQSSIWVSYFSDGVGSSFAASMRRAL